MHLYVLLLYIEYMIIFICVLFLFKTEQFWKRGLRELGYTALWKNVQLYYFLCGFTG